MAFYTEKELKNLGLLSFGENVYISNRASIYNPERIIIGDNVRIDDFCVLSAGIDGIEIGDYVHMAVFCSLIGAGKINIQDFANLSSRVSIYSSNDDYSGEHMTNPMVPSKFTAVTHADVVIGKHVVIGSGSVVLPGITIEEGVAIGALSLISKDCSSFGIYVGTHRIKERSRNLLDFERQMKQQKRC